MGAPRKPPEITEEQVEKMRQDLMRWHRRRREAAARCDKRRRRHRNDSAWREGCIRTYGDRCVVCGALGVEMDHIIPRAQGGKSVIPNGIPLCGQWSRTIPGGHHKAKTEGRLQFEYGWLTEGQRAYLADEGWVDWDIYGWPFGRGWKHFAPKTSTRPPDLDRPAGGG